METEASPKIATSRDVEIGRRVRALRLERGMSQTALGEGSGVTFQQVQKYETGRNRVPSGRLARMAHLLGVEPGYFFGSNGGRASRDVTRIDEFMADPFGAQILAQGQRLALVTSLFGQPPDALDALEALAAVQAPLDIDRVRCGLGG